MLLMYKENRGGGRRTSGHSVLRQWTQGLIRGLAGPRGPQLTSSGRGDQPGQLHRLTRLVYDELLLTVRDGRRIILVAPVEVLVKLSYDDYDQLADAGYLDPDDGLLLGREVLALLSRDAADEEIVVPPEGLDLPAIRAVDVRNGAPTWVPPGYYRPFGYHPGLESGQRSARLIALPPGSSIRVCRPMLTDAGLPLDGLVSATRHATITTAVAGNRPARVTLLPEPDYFTAVNDRQVTRQVELCDGDVIRFGDTKLTLRWCWRFGPIETAQRDAS